MKRILLLSTLFLLQQAAAQAPDEKAFTVKGFLPFRNGSTVRLVVDGQPVDTTLLQQDVYSFNGKTDRALPATLEFRKGKMVQFLSFFIEPGTIKIIDAGNNKLSATGTGLNDGYAKLVKEMDQMASFQASLAEVNQYRRTLSARYIAEHPASLISLRLLYDNFYLQSAIDDTSYYPLFQSLSPAIKNTEAGRKIAAEAAISYATALGATAPNTQLPDTARHMQRLYGPQGYTLIDFWASWCVPCRKENPALLSVFIKFHPLGFSITSVSLDMNEQTWKKAIAQDRLAWQQLNDFRSWSGEAVRLYGIKTIPMNFLVDARGTIIAKNLSPAQLEAKLSELLLTGNKPL